MRGQTNANIKELGVVAMARQIGLNNKQTGARTSLGEGVEDKLMSVGYVSLVGGMAVLYFMELKPWLLGVQV